MVVQFRGKKVILRCAGYIQAIKRDRFKDLVASNKRYRARKRNVPGIPTPNVDWEVRWEEPIPIPAPNEESFKPNYTGTLKDQVQLGAEALSKVDGETESLLRSLGTIMGYQYLH